MTAPERDLLDSFESTPSVSFDPSKGGIPEGEWSSDMLVTDYIKQVQAKDDNGKPKFYEDSGKPVMKAVLAVQIDGEDRALWAKVNNVEGGLLRELRNAQKAVKTMTGDPNAKVGPGVVIRCRWAWNTALPKKLGNHPKKYQVEVVRVGAPPAPKDDVLAEPTSSAPRQPGSDPWSSTPAESDEPPF